MSVQRTPMTRGGYERLRDEVNRLKKERPNTPTSGDRVTFGSTVKLEDEDGKETIYQIVGSDEADPKQGLISIMSPLARTLISKKVGDTVIAQLPGGKKSFAILAANFLVKRA